MLKMRLYVVYDDYTELANFIRARSKRTVRKYLIQVYGKDALTYMKIRKAHYVKL